MKKLIITLIIVLLTIITSLAQNIDLIAEVDGYYTGFREVAGNDQNAFIATEGNTGMLVLDISDPYNPYPVGLLEDIGQLSGGLALSGDFVYVCNFSFPGGTMLVVDVSDPTNPSALGSCQTPTLIGETYYCDGYCYLTCDYTVEIVDVGDPQSPQIIYSIEPPGDWPRSTVVYNDLAYITSYTGMIIYDVSDPAHPIQLGFFPAPDVYAIDVTEDYAIIETYVEDSLLVIDVSDPTDPVQVGSFYLGEEEICRQIRANGDFVYISKISFWTNLFEHGVTILDITNPANPQDAGCFGEWSGYLLVGNDYLLCSYDADGFRVYDITSLVNPEEIGLYHRTNPKSTLVSGNYAFVRNELAGIQVFDMSDIFHPLEVEFYYSPGNAMDFAMSGDYIYLADDEGGLRIINISDPYNLTEAGSYYYPGIEYDCVKLKDNYAITTGGRSLVMLDVSYPDSVFEVNSINLQTGSSYWELGLMGDYAILAISDSIKVLDISDPLHINLVGSCLISIVRNGLDVTGNYAYVPSFSPGGLSVVNLADPANPYEEAFLFEDVSLEDAEVVGDYCYLALYDGAFEIYNISHLSNPVLIGSYNTPSAGREVTVYDTLVFFGASPYFLIFDCSDYVSAGKAPEAVAPVKFELLEPYPNPFNAATTLSFNLPSAGEVSLQVFDITGREAASLVNGHLSLGPHSVVWDAEGLASGVYFVRLQQQNTGTPLHTQTRKVLLMK